MGIRCGSVEILTPMDIAARRLAQVHWGAKFLKEPGTSTMTVRGLPPPYSDQFGETQVDLSRAGTVDFLLRDGRKIRIKDSTLADALKLELITRYMDYEPYDQAVADMEKAVARSARPIDFEDAPST